MSPLACFKDFASQKDLNNSSKLGVLSSSIDATLGRLNDLFLGVEQDGSSTWVVIPSSKMLEHNQR